MTVLERSCEHLSNTDARGMHRLVSGLNYFGGRFDEERILGRKIVEQDLLDRSLAAPTQKLLVEDLSGRWCLLS